MTNKVKDIDPKENILVINEINGDMMHNAIEKITCRNTTLKIFISSYGGNLNEALALHDIIVSSKRKIITYAAGMCMSAGLIIFSAGHQRISYKSTNFLFHNGKGGTGFDNHLTVMQQAKEYKLLVERMRDCVIDRCSNKFGKNIIREKADNNLEYYFKAEEGLAIGLVDKIIQ